MKEWLHHRCMTGLPGMDSAKWLPIPFPPSRDRTVCLLHTLTLTSIQNHHGKVAPDGGGWFLCCEMMVLRTQLGASLTKTRFLPQWTVHGVVNVGCEGIALCSSQLRFLKSMTFASCLNSELQHRKVSQGQNKET